jgi:hypothetical protein
VAHVAAVKRLHADSPEQRERLRREASVLLGLDHPHLVRVVEVVDEPDGIGLVLQYAPGGSLADLLAERGRLGPGEVVAVATPIAAALASAHRRGVVHGDVKPANVLFTSDGEPLLADFGVARLAGRPATAEHAVSGTAEYLAPELLDGVAAGPTTDVYALGATCYEALTGTPPYTGPTPLAVVRAADRGGHAPLLDLAPSTPPDLAAVVERAIAREPGARFGSAEELAAALRSAAGTATPALPGLPASAGSAVAGGPGTRTFGPRPPRPEPPSPPPPRRRRAVVATVVLVTVAVAGGAAVVLAGGSDDADEPAPPCDEAALPVPDGAQTASGDVGGGCTTTAVYADAGGQMVLSVRLEDGDAEPARYGLGQPGDRLLLGDWECDGVDTAALYRPSTGEVIEFASWAPPGTEVRPAATVTAAAEGVPSVADEGGPDGCDAVVVE